MLTKEQEFPKDKQRRNIFWEWLGKTSPQFCFWKDLGVLLVGKLFCKSSPETVNLDGSSNLRGCTEVTGKPANIECFPRFRRSLWKRNKLSVSQSIIVKINQVLILFNQRNKKRDGELLSIGKSFFGVFRLCFKSGRKNSPAFLSVISNCTILIICRFPQNFLKSFNSNLFWKLLLNESGIVMNLDI